MNPWSLVLIGIGIIMIYIGWKGSQHSVLAGILGHSSTSAATSTANNQPGAAGLNTSGNAATNLSTGTRNMGQSATSQRASQTGGNP